MQILTNSHSSQAENSAKLHFLEQQRADLFRRIRDVYFPGETRKFAQRYFVAQYFADLGDGLVTPERQALYDEFTAHLTTSRELLSSLPPLEPISPAPERNLSHRAAWRERRSREREATRARFTVQHASPVIKATIRDPLAAPIVTRRKIKTRPVRAMMGMG